MYHKIEKRVKKIKTWTWKLIEYDDNTLRIERINDGFMSYELLGLIAELKEDIIQQMKGDIKADYIERKVIK